MATKTASKNGHTNRIADVLNGEPPPATVSAVVIPRLQILRLQLRIRAPGKYQWKAGRRFGLSARVAGPALEAVRRANGGSLTPAAVVDAARDPDHPLHPAFDWDDTAAAEKWREQQARVLINSVRVIVSGDDGPPVRVAFVSVTDAEGERGYRPSAVVMADPDMRQQALSDALAALDGWKSRYGHLEELADLFAAIDAAKKRVKVKANA